VETVAARQGVPAEHHNHHLFGLIQGGGMWADGRVFISSTVARFRHLATAFG
jgi:hypothetical protein